MSYNISKCISLLLLAKLESVFQEEGGRGGGGAGSRGSDRTDGRRQGGTQDDNKNKQLVMSTADCGLA